MEAQCHEFGGEFDVVGVDASRRPPGAAPCARRRRPSLAAAGARWSAAARPSRATWVSSKPTMLRSSGTRSPRARAASMHAERDLVAAGEDGRRRPRAGRAAPRRHHAVVVEEVPRPDVPRANRRARGLHGGAVAVQPGLVAGGGGRAADIGDAPVPEREQVLGRGQAAGEVRRADAGDPAVAAGSSGRSRPAATARGQGGELPGGQLAGRRRSSARRPAAARPRRPGFGAVGASSGCSPRSPTPTSAPARDRALDDLGRVGVEIGVELHLDRSSPATSPRRGARRAT